MYPEDEASLDLLLCPAFRQNIKINQGRNNYGEWLAVQVPRQTCSCCQFAKVNKLAAKQPENLDIIAQK